MMPITVDLERGDSISFDDKAILVHLAPKPSKLNPENTLPAEDITIFTPHIISIQHRVREIVELSPNEKAEFQETWNKLIAHPTVQ
jgi:hypothetical protein